jgi:hypothetical protein
MAQVYKTFTNENANNRNVRELTVAEKTQVSDILSNFISFFKTKHLG